MKIRHGFVSNSSSSSFIISSKTPNVKCKIIVEIDLSDLVNESVCTKEKLDEYIVEHWGWGDCDTIEKVLEDSSWLKETYDKAIECINNGEIIHFGEMGNEDYDVLSNFLYEKGLDILEFESNNAKIIDKGD